MTFPSQFHVLHNEPLAKYTAARLGGTADFLYVARGSIDELAEVVSMAWGKNIPVRVLGGGANVLVADKGVRGLVVINHVSRVDFEDWHEGRTVAATSGTGMIYLANKCLSGGYTGMEWAVSVPGTVGGAIVNNAGAHGDDMAASLVETVVLEKDGPKLYTLDYMQYTYRHSTLKAREDDDFVVLMGMFRLPPYDPQKIRNKMDEFRAHRKKTQPPGASLGSVFKNPPGDYAGRLIEEAGLKGHKIGDVTVSPVHANFFISGEQATASDYYALIQYVSTMVREKSGVTLEPEIELIGEWV